VVEQLLLNCTILLGWTYYLVQWQRHDSADDSWEQADHLAHCPKPVAEYEAAAPRSLKALLAALAAVKTLEPAGLGQGRPPPVPAEAQAPVTRTSWTLRQAG
jgi:hypothetical protein